MIATLATCIASAAIPMLGWLSATRRSNKLQHQIDGYLENTWHSPEEMAEFAGRCAWHDYVTVGAGDRNAVPPMVDDHLVPNFLAGFDAEEATAVAEFAEHINAALADGSLRLRDGAR